MRLWDPVSSKYFGDTMCVLVILDESLQLGGGGGFDPSAILASPSTAMMEYPDEEEDEDDEMSRDDIVAHALNMVNLVDQQLKEIAEKKATVDWGKELSVGGGRQSIALARKSVVLLERPTDPHFEKNK